MSSRGKAGKGKNYRMTSVMVEPEVYEEFLETLPRSKSVGEVLREYMKSVVDEHRNQKNLSSPNYSPLGQCDNTVQSKLDKFFPSHIMEWNQFKDIIEQLPDEERKKLTEIWLHDFRILEMINKQRNGSKVFPLLRI